MQMRGYIGSSVLEEYCLGLLNEAEQFAVLETCKLYPEIGLELTQIEIALEKYALDNAIMPSESCEQKIFDALFADASREMADNNGVQLINRHSNYLHWLKKVEHLMPTIVPDERFIHLITQEKNVTQMLIVSQTGVEMESHDDIKESFLILNGECQCTIGDQEFHFKQGDHFSIPLHTQHDIRVLTPYIVVIMQHLAA